MYRTGWETFLIYDIDFNVDLSAFKQLCYVSWVSILEANSWELALQNLSCKAQKLLKLFIITKLCYQFKLKTI